MKEIGRFAVFGGEGEVHNSGGNEWYNQLVAVNAPSPAPTQGPGLQKRQDLGFLFLENDKNLRLVSSDGRVFLVHKWMMRHLFGKGYTKACSKGVKSKHEGCDQLKLPSSGDLLEIFLATAYGDDKVKQRLIALDYGKTFELVELALLFEDENLVQFLEARLATLKKNENCKHYWKGACPLAAKCRFLHVDSTLWRGRTVKDRECVREEWSARTSAADMLTRQGS